MTLIGTLLAILSAAALVALLVVGRRTYQHTFEAIHVTAPLPDEIPELHDIPTGRFLPGAVRVAHFHLFNRTDEPQVVKLVPSRTRVLWPRIGLRVMDATATVPPKDVALLPVRVYQHGGSRDWAAPSCVIRMRAVLEDRKPVRATRRLRLDLPDHRRGT